MTQISSRTCGAGRGSEARHALSLLVFVVVAILPVVAGATLEPNRSSDLSLPDRALLHYSLLHVAIAVAGWVVLLASVAWTFVSIRRETDAGSTGWRAQLSVAGVALAVGVGSALVLLAVSAPFSLHPDAIRDLLLARDCMERAVCSSGPAGFAGGIKGTTWVRLLAQVFEAGGVSPSSVPSSSSSSLPPWPPCRSPERASRGRSRGAWPRPRS